MRTAHLSLVGLALAAAAAPGARADVSYLTQFRQVQSETSFNQNIQTVTAPGFGPFVETLRLATQFPVSGGGTALNLAETGIDCQLDPNAIRIVGSLAGAGGVSVVGGTPSVEFGEAAAEVETTFTVSSPTSYLMLASPRPSTRPGDRFQIKFENVTTSATLFELDQTMPARPVHLTGVLAPGVYSLEYEVELLVDGPETLRQFHFHLYMPAGCYANCDGSTAAPALNVADFSCFLQRYAAGDGWANCDGSTTAPVLNVADFSCFLGRYAEGCP